jgi:hypothetical protein
MDANQTAAELTDNEWVDAVAAAMRQLDPQLQPELALDAAKDLLSRPRWRAMAPPAAASKAFG